MYCEMFNREFDLPFIVAFKVDIFVGNRKSKFTGTAFDRFWKRLPNAAANAHGKYTKRLLPLFPAGIGRTLTTAKIKEAGKATPLALLAVTI